MTHQSGTFYLAPTGTSHVAATLGISICQGKVESSAFEAGMGVREGQGMAL
jgi:hypothetical protein